MRNLLTTSGQCLRTDKCVCPRPSSHIPPNKISLWFCCCCCCCCSAFWLSYCVFPAGLNSVFRSGCPGTQRSASICFLSATVKGIHSLFEVLQGLSYLFLLQNRASWVHGQSSWQIRFVNNFYREITVLVCIQTVCGYFRVTVVTEPTWPAKPKMLRPIWNSASPANRGSQGMVPVLPSSAILLRNVL